MPPRANTAVAGHPGDPQVSVDTYFGANGTGWFFTVARSATSLWARANNCADAAPSPLDVSALLSGGVPASCDGATPTRRRRPTDTGRRAARRHRCCFRPCDVVQRTKSFLI